MKEILVSVILMFLSYHCSAQMVEAETGVLNGTTIETVISGYSGAGYVSGFDSDDDAVTITVTTTSEGLYELEFGYAAPSGDKTNDVYVNGTFAGSHIFVESTIFMSTTFGKIYLEDGQNTVSVVKNWGYFALDNLTISPAQPNEIHHYASTLIDENATYEANILYRYLRDLYGHRIISGQQSYTGDDTEINYIENYSGKRPAIKGFDLIDYSPSRVQNGTTSEHTGRASEWWNTGGIVSMMWHWNAPKDLVDSQEYPWWFGFYTEGTTFDFTIAMNDPESEEYELLVRDIDAIAEQLKTLQDADVPLLWRPLHEAEGGWFWWGSKGPEACVWLWKLLYERLSDVHQLHNLIWVWTGTDSENALEWYPGDEFVDIIGADIYLADKNYSPGFTMFDNLAGLHDGKKIISMSETGTVPDPDKADQVEARWSWFLTWGGSDFIMNPAKNETSHINHVFNSEYVITLDELPDFYNYESPEFPDENEVTGIEAIGNGPVAFPNPAGSIVNVSLGSNERIREIQLYTLQGRLLQSFNAPALQTSLQINLLAHTAGIYLLRVKGEARSHTFRIIRQ